MTTNCFDVVSLFDFKNAKRQVKKRPWCVGSHMYVVMRLCRRLKLGFVFFLKGRKPLTGIKFI